MKPSLVSFPFAYRMVGYRSLGLAAILACAGGMTTARAQFVLAPLPTAPTTVTAPFAPSGSAITPSTTAAPMRAMWQVGPVEIHPRASYRLSHGNGILSRPGSPEKTTIQTFTAGVGLDGVRWHADYSPSYTIYSNPAFDDSLNHMASISTGAAFTGGSLQAAVSFADTETPLVETGHANRQETTNISLGGSFDLGNKTVFDTTFGQSLIFRHGGRQPGELEDAPVTRDWSNDSSLRYKFTDKLVGSAGTRLGYMSIDPGRDVSYFGPTLGLDWRPTEKIGVSANGAYQNRRFRGAHGSSMSSPSYGVSVQYSPFEATSVSVSGNRSLGSSYYSDQVIEDTSWSAQVSQRFFGRLQTSASYSRKKSEFVNTTAALFTQRNDKTESYSVSMSTHFLSHGSIGVSYSESKNNSTFSGLTYDSEQVSLDVSFNF